MKGGNTYSECFKECFKEILDIVSNNVDYKILKNKMEQIDFFSSEQYNKLLSIAIDNKNIKHISVILDVANGFDNFHYMDKGMHERYILYDSLFYKADYEIMKLLIRKTTEFDMREDKWLTTDKRDDIASFILKSNFSIKQKKKLINIILDDAHSYWRFNMSDAIIKQMKNFISDKSSLSFKKSTPVLPAPNIISTSVMSPSPVNLHTNNIESVIRFFEITYNYNTLFEPRKFFISKIPRLRLFIKTIMDYYNHNDLQLNYSNKDISNDTKLGLIKNVYDLQYTNDDKLISIFNLLDLIFKKMRNVIKKAQSGFTIFFKDAPISFTQTLDNDIDIFFYIVLVHTFPIELRNILRSNLHISNMEESIINKCKGILVQKDNVCDIMSATPSPNMEPLVESFDSIGNDSFLNMFTYKKNKSYSIDTGKGFGLILKLVSMLRSFSDRISMPIINVT